MDNRGRSIDTRTSSWRQCTSNLAACALENDVSSFRPIPEYRLPTKHRAEKLGGSVWVGNREFEVANLWRHGFDGGSECPSGDAEEAADPAFRTPPLVTADAPDLLAVQQHHSHRNLGDAVLPDFGVPRKGRALW